MFVIVESASLTEASLTRSAQLLCVASVVCCTNSATISRKFGMSSLFSRDNNCTSSLRRPCFIRLLCVGSRIQSVLILKCLLTHSQSVLISSLLNNTFCLVRSGKASKKACALWNSWASEAVTYGVRLSPRWCTASSEVVVNVAIEACCKVCSNGSKEGSVLALCRTLLHAQSLRIDATACSNCAKTNTSTGRELLSTTRCKALSAMVVHI
mmetsp:Transcript_47420/g.82821  ORF Transcript_47420/g.82821 Transcript_47420/m.82821 type:complete len:211 (-) Transcript_47420:219-851(-)